MAWLWKRKKTTALTNYGVQCDDALAAIKDIGGEQALDELMRAAGQILKSCGYDEVWPPRNGRNALHKNPDPEIQKNIELHPPSFMLAAEVFVHCAAVKSAISKNDISGAVYNSILAASKSERAFARHTYERDTVSAMKQRRGDGWRQGADDELLNKRIRLYKEAKAQNLVPAKYMHAKEKGVDFNSVVGDDYAYMRKYINEYPDRFV